MVTTMLVNDDSATPTRGVDITAVTKLKHTELWEATKAVGSQSELGRKLGVSPQEIGRWINLKTCPPLTPTPRWTQEKLDELQKRLLHLTGKTLDELWPPELRALIYKGSTLGKRLEQVRTMESTALEHYATASRERMLNVAGGPDTMIEAVENAVGTLPCREQEIVKQRFGLNGEAPKTLEEISQGMNITRERVRQIEQRGLQRLGDSRRASYAMLEGLVNTSHGGDDE